MQRTLREHIATLEEKIETLKAMRSNLDLTAGERYQAMLDLERAESALLHYREAFELEQKISTRSEGLS
ncbi:MAG TPA: hypothetical protein VKR52_00815 [Terracidiphilus sp.]|nr:hypothetical protein [Terracidiphilus sp.]